MMQVRFLAMSGSLRAASSNTSLLTAAKSLAPPGVRVDLYDGLATLPHFNPDLDNATPPSAVATLRREIAGTDALLICAPEYARGVPGALKNALDWMVSDVDFAGKPVALFNASPRATEAQAALRLILRTMSAEIVEAACITAPLTGRPAAADDIIAAPVLAEDIRRALSSLALAARRPA